MSRERLLEYLSSSSRVLHEKKDLVQWFEEQRREPGEEDSLEEVLESLISEKRLKCRSVSVGEESRQVYWLDRTTADQVCQTPPRTPHNVSTPVSGQHRKRVLSKFKSPLTVSKRIKTTESSSPESAARSDGAATPARGDKEGSSDELDQLMAEKKDLLARLHESEEKLRKLKLVRTHHAKNNLAELERLITKWREVSQDVAEQLLPKFSHSSAGAPTMDQLLDHLHIDYDTIRYSREDESFY